MAKDRDKELDQEEFSLEAILAEFGSGTDQRQGETPAAGPDVRPEAARSRTGSPPGPMTPGKSLPKRMRTILPLPGLLRWDRGTR